MRKASNFRVILWHVCGPGLRSRRRPCFAKIWTAARMQWQRLIISSYNIHDTSDVPGPQDKERQARALVRRQDALETAGWHHSL